MIRYPLLLSLAISMTLIAAMWVHLLPHGSWHLPLSILLIVLLGVPHGATDYQLFRFLRQQGQAGIGLFLAGYLLLMGLYGLLWWQLPGLSLGLFIVASVYHFGQSNWVHCPGLMPIERQALYLLWGGFVLAGPILLHPDEAAPIIQSLVPRGAAGLDAWAGWGVPLVLGGTVLVILGLAYLRGRLPGRILGLEVLNLGVLTALFALTPMMVGFAVYFVFWHALGSSQDQIIAFRRRRPGYHLGHFVGETIPFSLGAMACLGLLAWKGPVSNLEVYTGWVFVFISLVTLPHMILMEFFFRSWNLEAASPLLLEDIKKSNREPVRAAQR